MHEIMYPDDVAMSQVEATLSLAPELVKRRTILNHKIGKEFQRDIALQRFIMRQPDNPHSASPEHFHQRVTAKDFLSADELTRRRGCDSARALVSHLGSIFMIRMERKIKAKLGWAAKNDEVSHRVGCPRSRSDCFDLSQRRWR